MSETRILMTAPDRLFREGLKRLIGASFSIAGEARTIEDARRELDLGLQADLLLLDGKAVDVEQLRHIRGTSPSLKVVVLLDNGSAAPLAPPFQCGSVDGYIAKDASADMLDHSLEMVMRGQFVLPRSMAALMLERNRGGERVNGDTLAALSPRNIDVLRCLGAGYSNKRIAQELNISAATAKLHVKTVLRKINVRNRTQAALWAISHKLALALAFACRLDQAFPEGWTR
jgi:two-component system, NarL family, nitrate/nitrite response regulator NarL